MRPLLNFTLTMVLISGCTHGPRPPVPDLKPLMGDNFSVLRQPASIEKYRKVSESPGYQLLVADIDRCEETELVEKIPQSQIQNAISGIKIVVLKLGKIVSEISRINPDLGNKISSELNNFVFLFDGADSVSCGGTAAYVTREGKRTPAIYLSLKNFSLTSWQTVVTHEFSHLIMKSLGMDGGPLREAWVDLLALSVNEYRPYFAEEDGARTLALMEKNKNDPKTTEAMREIYQYSCVSPKAQRDFSRNFSLNSAYRDLQIHNISCAFVSAFLSVPISNKERHQILYSYLFQPLNNRVQEIYSSNFSDVLNKLFQREIFLNAKLLSDTRFMVSLDKTNDKKVVVKPQIPESVRTRVFGREIKPVALQIRPRNGRIAFQWVSYLDLYETDLTLSPTDSCVASSNCFCFESSSVAVEMIFLSKQNDLFMTSTQVNLGIGCFYKQ